MTLFGTLAFVQKFVMEYNKTDTKRSFSGPENDTLLTWMLPRVGLLLLTKKPSLRPLRGQSENNLNAYILVRATFTYKNISFHSFNHQTSNFFIMNGDRCHRRNGIIISTATTTVTITERSRERLPATATTRPAVLDWIVENQFRRQRRQPRFFSYYNINVDDSNPHTKDGVGANEHSS